MTNSVERGDSTGGNTVALFWTFLSVLCGCVVGVIGVIVVAAWGGGGRHRHRTGPPAAIAFTPSRGRRRKRCPGS